jgi:hypothetical protein
MQVFSVYTWESLRPQALPYNSYLWVRIREQIEIWVCIYVMSEVLGNSS